MVIGGVVAALLYAVAFERSDPGGTRQEVSFGAHTPRPGVPIGPPAMHPPDLAGWPTGDEKPAPEAGGRWEGEATDPESTAANPPEAADPIQAGTPVDGGRQVYLRRYLDPEDPAPTPDAAGPVDLASHIDPDLPPEDAGETPESRHVGPPWSRPSRARSRAIRSHPSQPGPSLTWRLARITEAPDPSARCAAALPLGRNPDSLHWHTG